MATFGKTTIGADNFAVSSNYKQVNAATPPVNAGVSSLWFYVDHSTGNQVMRALIYADSAGSPAGLLGASINEHTFTVSSDPGWYVFLFDEVFCSAGNPVWIGFIGGGPDDVAINGRKDDVSNARKFSADLYADGPSNPFGTVDGTDAYQFSMYAEYIPVLPGDNPPIGILGRGAGW